MTETNAPDAPCRYCGGHGWVQIAHDPDRDEDCVMCDRTGRTKVTTTFEASPLFHLDDPETSRLAAVNLNGSDLEQLMHAIVTLIDERGSLAPWELERIYQDQRGRRNWPRVAPYSVHRRASQLKVQVAVLRGTGERVAPDNGKRGERLGLTTDPTLAHAAITKYMNKGRR